MNAAFGRGQKLFAGVPIAPGGRMRNFLKVCTAALTRTMTSRYERLLLIVLSIVIVGPSLAHAQDGTSPIADVAKRFPVDAQGTTVLSSSVLPDSAGTTGTTSPGQSV